MTAVRRVRLATGIAVSAALLALSLAGASRAETYDFPAGRLVIHNLAGKAEVRPATGAGIKVELTRGGRDGAELKIEKDRDGAFDRLSILYTDRDYVYSTLGRHSRSTMSIGRDGRYGTKGNGQHRVTVKGNGSGTEAWADLVIYLPKGSELKLHNAVGTLEAGEVTASLLLDAASARVEAHGITGEVSIDVGSGDVVADRITGDLAVDTGSGSVEVTDVSGQAVAIDTGSGDVTGRRVQAAQLAVDTGSGDIELDDLRSNEMTFDTGSGSVSAGLMADVKTLAVDTGSGSVTLEVPGDFGAIVSIETGSGDISVDVPHQASRIRRSEFEGKIGDGQGHVVIETGSGDVRILAMK